MDVFVKFCWGLSERLSFRSLYQFRCYSWWAEFLWELQHCHESATLSFHDSRPPSILSCSCWVETCRIWWSTSKPHLIVLHYVAFNRYIVFYKLRAWPPPAKWLQLALLRHFFFCSGLESNAQYLWGMPVLRMQLCERQESHEMEPQAK